MLSLESMLSVFTLSDVHAPQIGAIKVRNTEDLGRGLYFIVYPYAPADGIGKIRQQHLVFPSFFPASCAKPADPTSQVDVRLGVLRDAASENKASLDTHTASINGITNEAKRKWEELSFVAENDSREGAESSAAKHCRMEAALRQWLAACASTLACSSIFSDSMPNLENSTCTRVTQMQIQNTFFYFAFFFLFYSVSTVDSASNQWKGTIRSVKSMNGTHVASMEGLVRFA